MSFFHEENEHDDENDDTDAIPNVSSLVDSKMTSLCMVPNNNNNNNNSGSGGENHDPREKTIVLEMAFWRFLLWMMIRHVVGVDYVMGRYPLLMHETITTSDDETRDSQHSVVGREEEEEDMKTNAR
jgi:hypothetical protein